MEPFKKGRRRDPVRTPCEVCREGHTQAGRRPGRIHSRKPWRDPPPGPGLRTPPDDVHSRPESILGQGSAGRCPRLALENALYLSSRFSSPPCLSHSFLSIRKLSAPIGLARYRLWNISNTSVFSLPTRSKDVATEHRNCSAPPNILPISSELLD